ncbi:MAG: hypothetical protein WBF44_08175, partial [Pseudolabrys sp.]
MITAGNDLKTIGGIRDVQLPLAVPAESLAEKVRRLLGKELAARLYVKSGVRFGSKADISQCNHHV